MGQQPSEWATFVVRADTRWWGAPIARSSPVDMSAADVIALLDGDPTAERTQRTFEGAALADDDIVAPVAAVAGPVVPGGWSVSTLGGPLLLDATDVRLLDALVEPVSVGELIDRAGLEQEAGRRHVTALAQAALVRRPLTDATPGTEEAATDDGPSVALPRPEVVPLPPIDPADPRIPVYAIWHPEVGPLLSLGMLTASARQHDGGALTERFDIRPPQSADSFLADLARRPGPAILLLSDYVFTITANLNAARRAVAINPDLIVLHGGPSSPKYEADAERFLHEHSDIAHVLTRGEGERTICELLEALADSAPALDPNRLEQVDGLTFRDPRSGETIRTPDRERIADLDSLPSPFLTGEFDHIPPEQWTQNPYFETNRGCPYKCTFCDWGSATQSRIRKFDIDRLTAEFEWAATRGLSGIHICDANFGILPRDVDIAQRIADVRRRTGSPGFVMFSPPKNTTRHISKMLDVLFGAGIAVSTSISLQTVDEATLDVVERNNISTDAYLALAADLRRRGHVLVGDLILGLPGQTYSSYKLDVQFMLDHEIMPRTFSLRMLPNSPMNAPEYKDKHQVAVNESQVVVATATLTAADRARASRLRKVEIITERYGVLRHVMRFLQWDHGVPATELMDAVRSVMDQEGPSDFPAIRWLFNYYDLFPVPPLGWSNFYEEVRRLVRDRFGVGDSTALRTVFALQEFLMPALGRHFPEELSLEHDYVSYYYSAIRGLYTTGLADVPDRPLADYGPTSFVIREDPLGLCDEGLWFLGDSRDEVYEGDFQMGGLASNEMDSSLVRLLPQHNSNRALITRKMAEVVERLGDDAVWVRASSNGMPEDSVRVELTGSGRAGPLSA